jgi:hypothetical protein
MNDMELHPAFGFPNPALIKQFELRCGSVLTSDYRVFLLQDNGGHPQAGYCKLLSPPVVIIVDVLFGVGLNRDFDLEYWREEYEDEIPSGYAIIGSDVYGNFLVLNMADVSTGVLLWDHLRLFGTSSDDMNVYRVAGTFTELAEKLFDDSKPGSAISGHLGPKLLENVWHRSGNKLQEINRVHYVQFAHFEGFSEVVS